MHDIINNSKHEFTNNPNSHNDIWLKKVAAMAKLSVDRTLLKAKSHAKQGEFEEAQKLYHVVLQAFPKNKRAQKGLAALNKPKQSAATQSPPHDTINQLINLYNQGQLAAVVKQSRALTDQYPKAFIIWNILGAAYKSLGKTFEASEAFKKVTELSPNYADGHSNLGVTLKDQGKLEEAITSYSKALSLKPDYADAYYNMGNVLTDQGKLKEAIEAYNKALAIKPEYADAYNNMGNALKDQGKLKEAIEAYNKAIAIKPEYADATENCLTLLTQVQGTVLNRSETFNQITEDKQLEMIQRPKFHILHAISSFLSADENQAQRHVHNFKVCASKLLDNLNPKDQVFCSAYSNYLNALLQNPLGETSGLGNSNVVYHIGESHCLSYAHRNLEINGETSRIAPMITFGAKAFHFSKANDSAFKAITKANLDSIPKGSQVFVSFGEIDCRPDEGFISAAAKLDHAIEDLISDTVTGYLQWFSKQNKAWSHNMYFVNVPAPEHDQSYGAKMNADVANVVALFNQQMEKQITQYNFNMIDVFEFTLGKDGFSNSWFHIDSKHLGAKALPKIEQQLNNPPSPIPS